MPTADRAQHLALSSVMSHRRFAEIGRELSHDPVQPVVDEKIQLTSAGFGIEHLNLAVTATAFSDQHVCRCTPFQANEIAFTDSRLDAVGDRRRITDAASIRAEVRTCFPSGISDGRWCRSDGRRLGATSCTCRQHGEACRG